MCGLIMSCVPAIVAAFAVVVVGGLLSEWTLGWEGWPMLLGLGWLCFGLGSLHRELLKGPF